MTDSAPGSAAPTEGIVMVLLSRQRRVRHLAVWAMPSPTAGPLCRNRGDFPICGRLDKFPGVPICTRCEAEVSLLASAVQGCEVRPVTPHSALCTCDDCERQHFDEWYA